MSRERVPGVLSTPRLGRVSWWWLTILAVVWAVLAIPASGVFVAGVVAVILGSLFHTALGGRGGSRLRGWPLLRFLPWFLALAFRGGVDVARRALSPSMALAPALLPYRIRLPDGAARVFFVNAISLLPGTFSAELRDAALTVHLLAPAASDEGRLRALEERVAGLWGLRLDPADPQG